MIFIAQLCLFVKVYLFAVERINRRDWNPILELIESEI